MGAFVDLVKTEEAIPLPTVDNNAVIEDLRRAISAPSLEQVRHTVKEEIMKHNFMTQIQLVKGLEIRDLQPEPRHKLFPDVLATVEQNIPVALIGPAGSGKSTLVEQVARALEKKFYLQNGVTGDHQLTGYMDAHGRYQTSTFRQAYQDGGLLMVDEADTSDPGAFKWINTAIANGYAVFPDNPNPIPRHADFRIVIAANTYGTGADRVYVGANQLDASTLDRFVFIDFSYDEELEKLVSGDIKWTEKVQKIRSAAKEEKARVVISPRASINGAKLLAIGWSEELVKERTIWKGMDPELKTRIIERIDGVKKAEDLKKKKR